MLVRGSGILLHITSLPSRYGVGDFGPAAYAFADFLALTGQCCWQILPLSPTSDFIGNSPYSSDSAYAGNPLLISPEKLVEDGWLEASQIEDYAPGDPGLVDFAGSYEFKQLILERAYARCASLLEADEGFQEFSQANAAWLDDYALFRTLKEHFGGRQWQLWPPEYRDRDPEALRQWECDRSHELRKIRFVQYVFFKQWQALRRAVNAKAIMIMGDAPIYVTADSADVWANREFFKLDSQGEPSVVAGVPPDYFSPTGQRWGNPVYDWQALKNDGYAWWVRRLEHNFKLYDFVRLDHFRGFSAYWEIPGQDETAENGVWVDGPGESLFKTLAGHFPSLPIIAEDLGVITAEVRELKDYCGFPGMKVLQFAFGDNMPVANDIPHNHVPASVAYTGTHDNTTTLGWYRDEAGYEVRRRFCEYVGREVREEEIAWELIRLAMQSVSWLCVLPMQDVLGLDGSARMNVPSKKAGNWSWRMKDDELTPEIVRKLRWFTEIYGRLRG